MKREIHQIDEYFAEELGNIEFNPPIDVWKNIEKELDRKRRVRFIAIWTSMAAGLALFLSLGLYILNNHKNDTKQVAVISKQSLHNLNTTPNNSKATKQYAVARISANKQPIADAKKSRNADSGQHSAVTNSNDNHFVIINKEDSGSDSRQVNTLPDVGDNDAQLVADNRFDNKSDSTIPNTTNAENNVSVIPLLPSDKLTNTDKPNTDIASNKEVANSSKDFGEINDEEKVKTKHWSLEGQVAPQYSYRNISDIKGNAPSKAAYNKSEDGIMAYGGGFKVNYQSGKRFSLQAGVYYSVMGQAMNNVYEVKGQAGMDTYAYNDQEKAYWAPNSLGLISTKESQTPDGQNKSLTSPTTLYSSIYFNDLSSVSNVKAVSTTQSTLLDNAKIIQQLKFIEIPFTVRYKFINKKIGCHILGGFSTNVLLNSNVLLKQNGSREIIGETSNLKRINYSSIVGLGIDYQWFNNISLSLEPTFKYYLNSVSGNEDMKVHPYSFGIFTGLVYKF